MKMDQTVTINFPGGIIFPGHMCNILRAAATSKIRFVRFGLRQQLLIDTTSENLSILTSELDKMEITYQTSGDSYPNIISSYPAEGIFIRNSWLGEGVYRDIFDTIDFRPTVKVNICDKNQSFTPMLTGNINWVASETEHYWHLIIRFPRTNVVFEWDHLCYTNNIASITKQLEQFIKNDPAAFFDNENASGEKLFKLLDRDDLILKPSEQKVTLSSFNLPYYEGLNRYNNKYWLGIYRRDELFSVAFLKKMCLLCMATKLGQLCCTSWKTIIIKGIDEQDKHLWNELLEEFKVNMRHGANELNFQVEDNCAAGLELKSYLVKHLIIDDIRTFGICFGIKTRKKSEVFSSILIRRRHLVNLLFIKLFPVYDILCAKNFNPNERTGEIFSSSNPKALLPEQLRRAVIKFYNYRSSAIAEDHLKAKSSPERVAPKEQEYLYQCQNCLTIYDESLGETAYNIPAGTSFTDLTSSFCCSLCEAEKDQFIRIAKEELYI